MSRYSGIFEFLANSNVFVVSLVLYFFSAPVIRIGRKVLEGRGYNVALSSDIGDIFIVLAIAVGIYILQRGAMIPWWMGDGPQHTGLFAAIVAVSIVGCWLTLGSRSGQVMDIYHDVVVFPTLLFLFIMLAPIVYLSGTPAQKIVALACVVVWAGLAVFDFKTGRIDQRSWLAQHGIVLNK
mgnify:CR=1 FL=1